MKVNAMAYAKMIRALAEGPSSISEVAEFSGLHVQTVRGHVAALRREKEVHRGGWGEDSAGRMSVELFLLGRGKDVPRQSLTGAQRAHGYRKVVAALTSPLLQLGGSCPKS